MVHIQGTATTAYRNRVATKGAKKIFVKMQVSPEEKAEIKAAADSVNESEGRYCLGIVLAAIRANKRKRR